jgi:hypothetical protein
MLQKLTIKKTFCIQKTNPNRKSSIEHTHKNHKNNTKLQHEKIQQQQSASTKPMFD